MQKLVVAGLVSLALVGCNSGSSGSNTGKVNLAFSDAPVDGLDIVCVAFDQISVHHTNGSESSWGTTSFTAEQSSEECIPDGYSIPEHDGNPDFMVINLMAYQGNDYFQVLSDEQLVAGKYTQMRLSVVVDDYYTDGSTPSSYVAVLDNDGNPVDPQGIIVPSGELKLDGFDVQADATQAYTLEFDLRKSMVLNNNGYQLKPRGVRLVNNENVATISGEVLDSEACGGVLDDAFVYVYTAPTNGNRGDLGSEFEPYTTAAVDVVVDTETGTQTGSFEVGYLPFGDYDIALVCNGSEDQPDSAGELDLDIDSVFVDETLTASGLTFTF